MLTPLLRVESFYPEEKAAYSFKTLDPTHQIPCYHIPEDQSLNQYVPPLTLVPDYGRSDGPKNL